MYGVLLVVLTMHTSSTILLGAISMTILSTVVNILVVKPLYEVPPLPKLEDTWWGASNPNKEDTIIRPFKINVSDEVLQDLQHRLSIALPFQEPLEGAKQHYGINTNLLKNIVDFWRIQYNWTERERFLNQFPQYTVNVQGLNIHYLHVKPKETIGVKVLPLLLLHGWPSSVREFYEIIPILTTPQQGRNFVFEVIVPSLPGYGFSQGAVRPGLGPPQMALLFKNFMNKLGCKKYYIQGGDWGGIIGQHMATLYPNNVVAIHSNMCLLNTALANLKIIIGSLYPTLFTNKETADKIYPLSKKVSFLLVETGYLHMQATKPDTIGVALRDSPVGLAGYILEKFITYTNPEWKNLDDGGLTRKYSLTNLLDNVMIYWVTGSITTSMRIYSEFFNKYSMNQNLQNNPINVPSGCARFSHELDYPMEWVLKDKYKNLIHLSDLEGGHFAAFEVPEVLAEDIYAFVKKVQKMSMGV